MSLVVAQATSDGPRIVSDTRVSFQDGQRPAFKTDTLKAVVISREVVICFAGDVASGLDGVRQFARGIYAGGTDTELIPLLTELTADRRRRVEFLIASGQADDQLKRIQDGRIEHSLAAAWIGDIQAFELFQTERNRPEEPWRSDLYASLSPGPSAYRRMYDAMKAVIDDPSVESVGNTCVGVAYTPHGFTYLESVFIHLGRSISVKPGEELINRLAQPVEEGGYAVSLVEPAEPGTPALALNFPKAQLSLLYLPLRFDGAVVVRDVPARELSAAILGRFGVVMKDPPLR